MDPANSSASNGEPTDLERESLHPAASEAAETGTAATEGATVDSDALEGVDRLDERQMRAIVLLNAGKSITHTAAALGVNRCTIYRWMEDAAFAQERHRRKMEIFEELENTAMNLGPKALETIEQAMSSDYAPRDRLAAATLLLKIAGLESLKGGKRRR